MAGQEFYTPGEAPGCRKRLGAADGSSRTISGSAGIVRRATCSNSWTGNCGGGRAAIHGSFCAVLTSPSWKLPPATTPFWAPTGAPWLSTTPTWSSARPVTSRRAWRPDDLIAYFCAEFGYHESFPIYSGGLGILAGDHCKTASDLGLPFVAVGLLYRQGYFNQRIDEARPADRRVQLHPRGRRTCPARPG